MEIDSIFEILKDKLWVVQYKGEEGHVVDQLIDNWTNANWLDDFFEKHESDLNSGFYNGITIEEAIEITINESTDLFDYIKENNGDNLDDIFAPLDDREYVIRDFQNLKAKGNKYKSWLRIYAVKFYDGFVITGGTIKLTKTMGEREHTEFEKKKLIFVRDSLKLNTVSDKFINLD